MKILIVMTFFISVLAMTGCKSKDEKLYNAVQDSDVEKVQELLKEGANPNAKTPANELTELTITARNIYFYALTADLNITSERNSKREKIIDLLIKNVEDLKKVRQELTTDTKPLRSLKKLSPEGYQIMLSKLDSMNRKLGADGVPNAGHNGVKSLQTTGVPSANFVIQGDSVWLISKLSDNDLKDYRQFTQGSDAELAGKNSSSLCIYKKKGMLPGAFNTYYLASVLPNKKVVVLQGSSDYIDSICTMPPQQLRAMINASMREIDENELPPSPL